MDVRPEDFQERLKQWANEIHYVGKIIWEMLFIKLPAVEAINEQA